MTTPTGTSLRPSLETRGGIVVSGAPAALGRSGIARERLGAPATARRSWRA
jgi:hypothetical protein